MVTSHHYGMSQGKLKTLNDSDKPRLMLTSISNRQLGQLFMMGFDGTEINDQIRCLIETHYVGTILLTAKNLKCTDCARPSLDAFCFD